jgi:hypothetical protein
METGQLTIRKNNKLTKNNSIELSIQIGLNGLSVSTLDRNRTTVDFFKIIPFNKRQTPFYIKQKLEDAITLETKLQRAFSKVTVIHDNNLSTLVPKALFNKEHLADYLKFNAKILQTDFITFDEFEHSDIVNVFVPYVNVNNYIYDTFGAFTYKHSSTILIDSLLNQNDATNTGKMIVNVSTSHFDVVVLKDGLLSLYNTFEYATKEDFIYFILFTLEQLKLDPETLQLELLGSIKESDDLYTILYQYIRHLHFGNRMDGFTYSDETPKSSYSNYTILKSF